MNDLKSVNHLKIGLIVIFSALFIKLFYMQIIMGEDFKKLAEKNYLRVKKVSSIRGEIYDRNYRPIVTNTPSLNLYIHPEKIKDSESLYRFLDINFPEISSNLRQLIHENRYRLYQEILLLTNVPYEKVITLSEYGELYPALQIIPETTRKYEYPNHFTGYVSRINREEYTSLKESDYTQFSMIGKTGLEKQYESVLRGKSGYELIQVDAFGRKLHFLMRDDSVAPQNGADLILTIDNRLQTFVMELFPQNERGAIVIMDVQTGGILAYYSHPVYNPNLFMNPILTAEWDKLINNPSTPLLDRISHGTYPPASVYKIIPALLGLEKGIINRTTKLEACIGGMQIGNQFINCWLHSGHGKLNVIDAIKYSCDVFFYDLSLQLNLDDFFNFSKSNMLTVATGIDIPNERSGFFPTHEWYIQNYGKSYGSIGHKVNLSIGQGEILTTPLQIVAFFAAIANNGLWFQPHFLDKTMYGNMVDVNVPYVKELPLSQEYIAIIQEALYKTVNEAYGTGVAAGTKSATVYGKTGSAENHLGNVTHAWFTGYANWKQPEIAFAIFLENAGGGGSVAAPLAKKIVDFWSTIRNEK
jgi:penicillin-binding protein 2